MCYVVYTCITSQSHINKTQCTSFSFSSISSSPFSAYQHSLFLFSLTPFLFHFGFLHCFIIVSPFSSLFTPHLRHRLLLLLHLPLVLLPPPPLHPLNLTKWAVPGMRNLRLKVHLVSRSLNAVS